MRRKIIAGNWKMFNNLSETVKLIDELKAKINNEALNCDVIVCPPFTSLETADRTIKGSVIKLGSQNMYFEENGAYTGEISASMLKSTGCEFVILGHSERRTIFKESNELINKKIKKALASGLKPIFCIGETLQEREEGITEKVVKTQVVNGLKDISADDMGKIIVAYEPVWAIGTGKTATPDQAQEVHSVIRNLIAELYSKEVAGNLVIQYGGSVKPDNAAQLLSQPDIDGALVGGACLKADSFFAIIKAA
ncbi:MAG: triose-phosphate isomerase [Ignavibacteriales bacterium]|nr:MAG: triose-phosphate isomerase [Ignavibacteriales bacterium]